MSQQGQGQEQDNGPRRAGDAEVELEPEHDQSLLLSPFTDTPPQTPGINDQQLELQRQAQRPQVSSRLFAKFKTIRLPDQTSNAGDGARMKQIGVLQVCGSNIMICVHCESSPSYNDDQELFDHFEQFHSDQIKREGCVQQARVASFSLPNPTAAAAPMQGINTNTTGDSTPEPHTRKKCIGKDECKMCGRRFAEPEFAERHSKTHQGNFECDICHVMFNSAADLKKHLFVDDANQNGHELNLYHCHLCWDSFPERDTLHKHVLAHSNGNVTTYCCPRCPKHKGFKTVRGLHHHERNHAKNEELDAEAAIKGIHVKLEPGEPSPQAEEDDAGMNSGPDRPDDLQNQPNQLMGVDLVPELGGASVEVDVVPALSPLNFSRSDPDLNDELVADLYKQGEPPEAGEVVEY